MNIELNEKVTEIIGMMREYVQRSLPELRTLGDGFYAEDPSDQWGLFSQLMEGLQWMFDAFQSIDGVKSATNLPVEWLAITEIFSKLEEQIALLWPAFEGKNWTLVGDMLNYEIAPLFEELQQQVSQSIA